MTATVLERAMYTEAQAARLLGLSQSTLHYWLEGGARGDRSYLPVIRVQATRARSDVTWAEFVEAGLLRSYRRDAKVPMRELRRFVEALRQELQVPYPLADRRPWVTSGRGLVLEAQRQADLPADWWLVVEADRQVSLMPAADAFFRRVLWAGDSPAGWRIAGVDSPVLVDPEVRFGRPQVAGVSTEVLWEHRCAGESDAEIAAAFDLDDGQLSAALAFEASRQPVGTA